MCDQKVLFDFDINQPDVKNTRRERRRYKHLVNEIQHSESHSRDKMLYTAFAWQAQ